MDFTLTSPSIMKDSLKMASSMGMGSSVTIFKSTLEILIATSTMGKASL